MARLLLLSALFTVILWFFRRVCQRHQTFGHEKLVPCQICHTFIPLSKARRINKKYYCPQHDI